MNRTAAIVVAGALIGAGLAAGGYWLGQRSAQHAAPVATPAASSAARTEAAKTDSAGRRILYWHDPMYPQQKFDKPGKSPFMNMDLVPVYADAAEGGVAVSPRVRQSLGMRIAAAEMTELRQDVAAVGKCKSTSAASRVPRCVRRLGRAAARARSTIRCAPGRCSRRCARPNAAGAGGVSARAPNGEGQPRTSRWRMRGAVSNRSGSLKRDRKARANWRREPPPAARVADLGRRNGARRARRRDGAGRNACVHAHRPVLGLAHG